jgi:fucose permease
VACAAVTATVVLTLTRGLLPAAADRAAPGERGAGRSLAAGLSPIALALGVVGACSFVGESSAADWSALYLREEGAGPGAAALGFAAFSFAMTVGRFASDPLIARFGSVPVVRAGAVLASASLAAGLTVGGTWSGVLAFGVLGLGLASAIPAVLSAAGELGHGALARATSLSYIGGVAAPPAIGWLADRISLASALRVPVATALAIALLAGILSRPRQA